MAVRQPSPRSGAGRSARAEYERRLASWRTRSQGRFLRGLPVVAAIAVAVAWWVGWHTLAVPAYGCLAGLAVLGAWASQLRAPQHVAAWKAGADGERRVARVLRPLTRHGVVVLHDRALPRSRANIDHLVIGGMGIVVVDAKNWRARGARVALGRDGRLWYGQYPQDKTIPGSAVDVAG